MGEAARLEVTEGKDEAFVHHDDCPWHEWHQRHECSSEDRPGCDAWFGTTVARINERLGTRLKVETLKALPDGDSCCRRRLWVD